MEKKNFNFIEFIEDKGFSRLNDKTFIFRIVDEQVYLHIDRGDYIVPVSLDLRFRKEISKSEEQAEKEFKTIEEIIEISFEK